MTYQSFNMFEKPETAFEFGARSFKCAKSRDPKYDLAFLYFMGLDFDLKASADSEIVRDWYRGWDAENEHSTADLFALEF